MTQVDGVAASRFRENSPRNVAILAVLLAAVSLTIHGRAMKDDFILLDDPAYITQNPHVLAGVSGQGIRWALTSLEEANWHPVTWISHMVDAQLFELDPAGHHRTSILLHALNAVLLFLLIRRMTGSVWRSALVAALFALHPLNVESVAWVAERKNVLSTLFWIVTLWAYVSYTRQPTRRNYAQVVVVFALGLMAKPMLVTLPFVLLLLDYWPLQRTCLSGSHALNSGDRDRRPASIGALLVEKIPLFALSAASSFITVKAQSDTLASLQVWTLADRLANAVISYAAYIYRTFWPTALAVIYPLPPRAELFGWRLTVAAALLVLGTGLALWCIRTRPYFLIGWLWFLGTLAPVIGIVQVGLQSNADRYAYVPCIGLFIAFAWAMGDIAEKIPPSRVALISVCALVLVLFTLQTRKQIDYWHNSTTLFRHAVMVIPNNYAARFDLGQALKGEGDYAGALQQFQAALQVNGNSLKSATNLEIAQIKMKQGKLAEAEHYFNQAAAQPNSNKALAAVRYNLAYLQEKRGEVAGSEREYQTAIRLNPRESYYSRLHLAVLLFKLGRYEEAAQQYGELIKVAPSEASLYFLLGETKEKQGQPQAAAGAYRKTLELNADYAPARIKLKLVSSQLSGAKLE